MLGEIQAVADIMKSLFGRQLGAVAPAFNAGGGGPPGLLGGGGGLGESPPSGLLDILSSQLDPEGGVTEALKDSPVIEGIAPPASGNPLGTNDAVNALPGVDQELLDMLEQQNQPNFLEGLLGGLFGGR